jgi:hypothetical protein
MAKDRLDGTKRGSFLYELFTLPGRIILWVKYMNPQSGYAAVRKSSRRAGSPIMTFLYSLLFWSLAIFFGFIFISAYITETAQTLETKPTHYINEYAAEYNDDDGIER